MPNAYPNAYSNCLWGWRVVAKIKIVGVSGSLRQQSFNTALLRNVAGLLPADAELLIYRELAELPLFNPDIDALEATPAVAHWRAALRAADAVIFSTPEYAHGVPGALKNALDWVVGSGELVDKPMLLFSASSSPTGGDKASAHLAGTLQVMTGAIIEGGELCVGSVGKKIDANGRLHDEATITLIQAMLLALLEQIKTNRAAELSMS